MNNTQYHGSFPLVAGASRAASAADVPQGDDLPHGDGVAAFARCFATVRSPLRAD